MDDIASLSVEVASGRVRPDRGRDSLAQLAAAGALPLRRLAQWFGTAVWLAGQEERWEHGLLLGWLLEAAPERVPDGDPGLVARCLSDWTEVAHLALVHRPDAGLHHSAARAGHLAVELAAGVPDDALTAEALFRLGTLFLDPCSRPRTGWWDDHRLWLGLAPADCIAGLPEPAQALPLAERHLRSAARLQHGAALGHTLRALAQAVQQQGFIGLPVDHDEVDQLCGRALALLPQDDVTARAAVEWIRSDRPAEATGLRPDRHR